MAFMGLEDESFPSFQDFAFLPLLAAFFPAVRFLLDRFIFEVYFLFSFLNKLRKDLKS